jgi:hypothetical protein
VGAGYDELQADAESVAEPTNAEPDTESDA